MVLIAFIISEDMPDTNKSQLNSFNISENLMKNGFTEFNIDNTNKTIISKLM